MIDRRRLVQAYAWCAIAILILQIGHRLGDCGVIDGCAVSLAKGAVWAALWPAWLVAAEFPTKGLIVVNITLVLLLFVAGTGRQGAGGPVSPTAAAAADVGATPSAVFGAVGRGVAALSRTKKYWLLPVIATAVLVVIAVAA